MSTNKVKCSICGKMIDVNRFLEHYMQCQTNKMQTLQSGTRSRTMRVPASKIEVV